MRRLPIECVCATATLVSATTHAHDNPAGRGVVFQAVSAEWIARVPAGGGQPVMALRITFVLPLDPNNIGDIKFYERLLLGGWAVPLPMNGHVTLGPVSPDADDAFAVLLAVGSHSGDVGIAADGKNEDEDFEHDIDDDGSGNEDGLLFSINIGQDRGAAPLSFFGDIYGDADHDGVANDEFAQLLTIQDAIPPRVVAAGFVDCDGDGVQDAAGLMFDEPLFFNGARQGASLRRVGDVLVHPVALIDRTTGERPERLTSGISSIPVLGSTRLHADADFSGSIEAREMNSVLALKYDPHTVDWDGDGLVGTADTDGEALGGTGDASLVSVILSVVKTNIADAALNTVAEGFSGLTDRDLAAPVVVGANYHSGESAAAWFQSLVETDGAPCDQEQNDQLQLVFSEPVGLFQVAPTRIRFGPGPTDSFGMGDVLGVGGVDSNLVIFVDSNGAGLDPGDTINILNESGIEDCASNAVPGVVVGEAIDTTAPYIPLVRDRFGNVRHQAYKIDVDSDDVVDEIKLCFTDAIDADTVEVSDFAMSGIPSGAVAAIVSGSSVVLTAPPFELPINEPVIVTYRGASDGSPIASSEGWATSRIDTAIPIGLLDECPQDLNGDGLVNSSDLANLLANWGPTIMCEGGADFNSDGVVNSSDLARILARWGVCPQ